MDDSLFCDESFLDSPPPSPVAFSDSGEERDRVSLLSSCLEAQSKFYPATGYLEKLRKTPELSLLRLRAARWILVKARPPLNLTLGTAFSALNYLDRFVSMYTHLKWQGWMMELLSVACVSIAAKFEEVQVSSLHTIPTEELENSFHPRSIQQMELTVLTSLDWRLNCVTAHSFLSPLTHQWSTSLRSCWRRAAADRAAELLTISALDLEFLQFSPFVVAASAAKHAMDEFALSDSIAAISDLDRHISKEHMEEMKRCFKCMDERVADPDNSVDFSTTSPATVILPERGGISITVLSDSSLFHPENNSRKRKNRNGPIDR